MGLNEILKLLAASGAFIAVFTSCTGLRPQASSTEEQVIRGEILAADAVIENTTDAESGYPVNEVSRPVAGGHKQTRIPLEVNREVQRWIEIFSGRGKALFSAYYHRGLQYKPSIQRILKEHKVPQEIYYLALIESGYVTHARSRQKAVGVWQFIPSTAKRYGLRINRLVDERRDPIRATRAAARYLKHLHGMFGSWYLAMAAYNAGEGRLMRAVARAGTRDFWELVERQALPPETINYVPKFLAAVIIGRNPEKYGFKTTKVAPRPEVRPLAVKSGARLRDVARQNRLGHAQLVSLNPHLLGGVVPGRKTRYELWVPASATVSVRRSERRPAKQALHRVRRGESLIRIAKRYRTTVKRLIQVNQLADHTIVVGQALRL